MLVKREDLITQLEATQPGLAFKELQEQSSCFVFKDGKVMTYNDEIAVTAPSHLDPEFKGAVASKPLLDVLRKMSEDEIDVEAGDKELLVRGKRRRGGVRMEHEVMLPIENVDKPKTWTKLHGEFTEALSVVQECAGKDESHFYVTCVHLHPEWVEACDNSQMARYKLTSGIQKRAMIRGLSARCIAELDVTKFSDTESWIHFKNPSGIIISVRKYSEGIENFDDLSPHLKEKGTRVVFPPDLAESAERVEVFSGENKDENLCDVQMGPLKGGTLRIKGIGDAGWWTETKKVVYKGKDLKFRISPKLLVELLKRSPECEVTKDKLKIDGGKFFYIATLSITKEGDEGVEE